jgi:phage I-like protein
MTQARAAFDQAVTLEGAPEWIPLNPFGTFTGDTPDGPQTFVFDDSSLASVQAALAIRGNPWVLDWHHNTLKVEAGQKNDAPAAGFITALEVRDGFVYGRMDWSPEGETSVASKEYNFVSPVLNFDESSGRVLSYHSFALTNRPGTWSQRRIGLEASNLENPNSRTLTAALERGRMDWLLVLLGLSADTPVEQVRAALESRLSLARFGGFVQETLGLEVASLESTESRARVIALAASEGSAAQVATLQASLEAERASRGSERQTGMVQAALEDGRILENQRSFWLTQAARDENAARVALEGLPKLVPQSIPNAAKLEGQAALEANQVDINKMLGVSPESFLKYNGGKA